MKTASILLLAIISLPLMVYGGAFSLAAEGHASADLYETGYFAGLSPEYRFLCNGRQEISLSLPVRFRGELYIRDDFAQHTRFISIGAEAGWFFELLSAKKIRIVWGPDACFNYGFPPLTRRTTGEETETVRYSRYFVHSGGISLPVRFDFRPGRRWGVRLTQPLFGILFDSRLVEGYSSTIEIEAGLKPAFSPKVAVVYLFGTEL